MFKNQPLDPPCGSKFILISIFELICQWCERMYLCGFVSFYVGMFVARANKVEGTMS